MNKDIRYEDKPWLSHYEKGIKANLDYHERCLPEFLDKSVADFPDKTAYIFQGFKISFREFDDMVKRFASCLAAFGIKKGDSVAVLLPNLIPCAVAYYGIIKIGAIAVMNNPLYSDPELKHQFNDSNSKVLITLDLLGNRMIDLRPETTIKQIIYTSIGDYLPFPKNLLFPLVGKKKKLAADVKKADELYKWKDIMRRYPPNPPEVRLDLCDIAMYQYTGGTTGISKAAILTHGNLSKQAQQINGWISGLERGREIMLGALPFFHVMGLTASLNFAICNAWTNILVPKPQPGPLLESMSKFRPTFAPLVPTMFIGLLGHPDIGKTDLGSIKVCISGSAPLPVEVIKGFEDKTGSIIIEAFGMTESSPATHVNPLNKETRKIGSIGIPIADTECRIADLTNPEKNAPVGTPGELVIKGPQIMRGYLNMDEETGKALVNGWLHTGDIATMDGDGYFYIVDRIKDMIISGGYNVYPRDIDEVLFSHPKIHEACAVGLPHPTRGEQIKAFVVLKEGETAGADEIIDYCKTRLAKYKLPTAVRFMEELPKTNVGKILRKELRRLEMESSL